MALPCKEPPGGEAAVRFTRPSRGYKLQKVMLNVAGKPLLAQALVLRMESGYTSGYSVCMRWASFL